jgi:hypothetical protein
LVESYRFWDVVSLWGRETLQHEVVVARALARGVVRDGLRMQSVDPKWQGSGTFDLQGASYVGYVAKQGALPIVIRASALKHMMAVVEKAANPDPLKLHEEFVAKQDFSAWLLSQGAGLPGFWFSGAERSSVN